MTVKVCKIWSNDVYMYILYCDIFGQKLIDRIFFSQIFNTRMVSQDIPPFSNFNCFAHDYLQTGYYGEFLKDRNVLLCPRLYKYAPNLESLLTQQYVCVMCTLRSDNTCVFTRFHSVKNANMQLIWSSVIEQIVLVIQRKAIFP